MNQWRSVLKLSGPEAAFVSQHGNKSPNVEVCCLPGTTSFSTVENEGAGFGWKYFSADGAVRDHGTEDSQAGAKQAALETMRLWTYRCPALGLAVCPGFCLEPAQSLPAPEVSGGIDCPAH